MRPLTGRRRTAFERMVTNVHCHRCRHTRSRVLGVGVYYRLDLRRCAPLRQEDLGSHWRPGPIPGTMDLVPLYTAHPGRFWSYVLGYLVLGLVWSVKEVIDLINENHAALMKIRKKWLLDCHKERFLSPVTDANQRILDGDDQLPEDLRLPWTDFVFGNKAQSAYLDNDLLGRRNPAHMGNSDAQSLAAKPTWNSIKGPVAVWTAYWVFYAFIWVFDSFLREFFDKLVSLFRGVYERVINRYHAYIQRDFVMAVDKTPEPPEV